MQSGISVNLGGIRKRIEEAERRYHRAPGSVSLLAVTKLQPIGAIEAAYAAGQRGFGENHLQEAVAKIERVTLPGIEWHFIGPVQSNKTRPIARHFDWVHSVDRLKIAERLSTHRDDSLAPLNVCIQVNISGEATKSGVELSDLSALAASIAALPRLKLRGLMAIPHPEASFEAQRAPFRAVREQLGALGPLALALDTLSMGMSDDMEAAIAEGATIVRIGTAIFGPRG